MSIGYDLLDVPFPQLVSSLGIAIAQSQFNLDKNSIEILKIMGNRELAPVYLPNFRLKDEATFTLDKEAAGDDGLSYPVTEELKTSMIGAGFQPTFYQFAETIVEVKIAITISNESQTERTVKGQETTTTTSRGAWWFFPTTTVVKTTPVDAKYTNKYNYTAEGSSLLRTRLVPMPPNAFMQRMLEMKAQAMQQVMELELKKVELALEVEKARQAQALKDLEENAAKEIDKAAPNP